ncbi:hypothetical protein Lalb_Chr18g0044351 [Lupinus albus]|uniref:Uncharacterized protein n=1 Tax=Lupinus albus TaxID=3870 RepID=A0A6A4P3M3_LUPAL|nr:hypothetical protein Lalb_Chr18g0044351 [Lupinus albus]
MVKNIDLTFLGQREMLEWAAMSNGAYKKIKHVSTIFFSKNIIFVNVTGE